MFAMAAARIISTNIPKNAKIGQSSSTVLDAVYLGFDVCCSQILATRLCW